MRFIQTHTANKDVEKTDKLASVICANKSEEDFSESNLVQLIARTENLIALVDKNGVDSSKSSTTLTKPPPISLESDQVDWLLQGVPEAFCDHDQKFDDEYVDNLLHQNGSEPAQLQFPSLFAANQSFLTALPKLKSLNICIQRLSCVSVNAGLRKRGSFLLLYPPACVAERQPRRIELTCLSESADLRTLSTHSKKDALRNFFVGDCDPNATVSWHVNISEPVVLDWLGSTQRGAVMLELYSHLVPEGQGPGRSSSAVLLGSLEIPLSSLLRICPPDTVVQAEWNALLHRDTVHDPGARWSR